MVNTLNWYNLSGTNSTKLMNDVLENNQSNSTHRSMVVSNIKSRVLSSHCCIVMINANHQV